MITETMSRKEIVDEILLDTKELIQKTLHSTVFHSITKVFVRKRKTFNYPIIFKTSETIISKRNNNYLIIYASDNIDNLGANHLCSYIKNNKKQYVLINFTEQHCFFISEHFLSRFKERSEYLIDSDLPYFLLKEICIPEGNNIPDKNHLMFLKTLSGLAILSKIDNYCVYVTYMKNNLSYDKQQILNELNLSQIIAKEI